jgi:hypothetical protein
MIYKNVSLNDDSYVNVHMIINDFKFFHEYYAFSFLLLLNVYNFFQFSTALFVLINL